MDFTISANTGTFQLTTSRRGRRSALYQHPVLFCYFNSRPHEEVDSTFKKHWYLQGTFQLTTSRRGRPFKIARRKARSYFNSRPHEDVDVLHDQTINTLLISTHDLTKRSTGMDYTARFKHNISTHDLTKRSTIIHFIIHLVNRHFNSRPHEEVDCIYIGF